MVAVVTLATCGHLRTILGYLRSLADRDSQVTRGFLLAWWTQAVTGLLYN